MKLKRTINIEYHWDGDKKDLFSKEINLDEIAETEIFKKRLEGFNSGKLEATVNGIQITGEWSYDYNYKKTGLRR